MSSERIPLLEKENLQLREQVSSLQLELQRVRINFDKASKRAEESLDVVVKLQKKMFSSSIENKVVETEDKETFIESEQQQQQQKEQEVQTENFAAEEQKEEKEAEVVVVVEKVNEAKEKEKKQEEEVVVSEIVEVQEEEEEEEELIEEKEQEAESLIEENIEHQHKQEKQQEQEQEQQHTPLQQQQNENKSSCGLTDYLKHLGDSEVVPPRVHVEGEDEKIEEQKEEEKQVEILKQQDEEINKKTLTETEKETRIYLSPDQFEHMSSPVEDHHGDEVEVEETEVENVNQEELKQETKLSLANSNNVNKVSSPSTRATPIQSLAKSLDVENNNDNTVDSALRHLLVEKKPAELNNNSKANTKSTTAMKTTKSSGVAVALDFTSSTPPSQTLTEKRKNKINFDSI